MPTIKLQSSDGEVFPVDVDIARQSVTIRTMLEDLGMEEEEDEAVPLPNVNAAILKKVNTIFGPLERMPRYQLIFCTCVDTGFKPYAFPNRIKSTEIFQNVL